MTAEENLVQDCLQRSIESFSTDPLAGRTMRRFATDAPGLFAPVALRMLMAAANSPGYRYLATLVVWQPTLFRQLSNPCIFTRTQAVQVAKRLMEVDSTLDVRLARQLPARNGVTPDTLTGQHAERALDIIDEISPGRLVVPILSHLARHPDQKISSKATLLIGKRVQNVVFARRVIAEGTDPRVRANALEAIWGEDSPEVRQLFWDCIEDRHNRVVGNAMVGLYLIGEPQISDLVKRYSKNDQPDFRMTAAWTMGRIGDTEFIPILSPLMKDQHPGVRGAALRSLQNIRQIEKDRRPSETQVAALVPTENQKPAAPERKSTPFVVELPPDGSPDAGMKSSRYRKISQW